MNSWSHPENLIRLPARFICRQGTLLPRCLTWLLIFLSAGAVNAQSPAENTIDKQLKNSIESLVKQHRGKVGLAIRNLKSGEHYEFNADTPMPTASLIKLPLLITTYRMAEAGKVDLSRRVVLKEEDKVPGSGELTQHFTVGTSLPLVDYARLMTRHSDNTATNIVAREVGLDANAKDMESLGLKETKLHSFLYRGSSSIFPSRSRRFGIGSTTANEMVELLGRLEAGTLMSAVSAQAIREHLLACDDNSKLARKVSGVRFAHKTGEIANSRTDAGVLYTEAGPVAVCFLTAENEDQSFDEDNPAHLLAGEIGQAIIERFGIPSRDATLQAGAFGKIVEALQRTLNDRLTPSPGLSIDGDFGPATQNAVERFQRVNKLLVTGKVTTETWKALGTLIERDKPVPQPDVVNAQQLPTSPQWGLQGPPFVTCKAWAIFDADNGEQLYQHNADTPLEAASTTKIMTAFVVLQSVAEQATMLDEMVTFSSRADSTPGSTAAIRAGEQVTVRELLYGLMLPSGNDASVALAEHIGDRVALESSESPDASAYEFFVKAMNSTAKRLGMNSARYINTHGLPDERHVISAKDLGILSLAALESKLFRKIVSTRQFGCVAKSLQGYSRNLMWKNTNRLLGTDGFSGVKTGTTSAAGACLVALGERQEGKLLVVTLGSSSSDARYADTQNLFRWAWQQRANDLVAEQKSTE